MEVLLAVSVFCDPSSLFISRFFAFSFLYRSDLLKNTKYDEEPLVCCSQKNVSTFNGTVVLLFIIETHVNLSIRSEIIIVCRICRCRG